MPETQNNTSYPDIPDIFSTYKSTPIKEEGIIQGSMQEIPKNIQTSAKISTQKKEENTQEIINIPPYESSFQKKMYIFEMTFRNILKITKIIIDGCIRCAKILVWSVAVFGGLFVASLATNTIDRAIDILNKSVFSKVGTNLTIPTESSAQNTTPSTGLQSNTVDTTETINTPESIAAKRRAVLEARKAAKILEEKQQAIEQSL